MLSDIVDYSEEFLTNSQFPDKAIDLLDLICSHVKIKKIKKPKALQNLEKEFVKSLSENTAPNEKQNKLFEKMKTQVTMVTKSMIFPRIITLNVHILGVNAFFAKSENTKSHC